MDGNGFKYKTDKSKIIKLKRNRMEIDGGLKNKQNTKAIMALE